jgi:hypothetical protein
MQHDNSPTQRSNLSVQSTPQREAPTVPTRQPPQTICTSDRQRHSRRKMAGVGCSSWRATSETPTRAAHACMHNLQATTSDVWLCKPLARSQLPSLPWISTEGWLKLWGKAKPMLGEHTSPPKEATVNKYAPDTAVHALGIPSSRAQPPRLKTGLVR